MSCEQGECSQCFHVDKKNDGHLWHQRYEGGGETAGSHVAQAAEQSGSRMISTKIGEHVEQICSVHIQTGYTFSLT